MNKDMDVLVEIAKLRSRYRQLLALTLSVGSLFGFLLWFDRAAAKTELRAEQFVLLDHSHRPVARLRNEGSGACLEVSGESKMAGAALCAADELGSYLSLTNRGGETHAIVSTGVKLSESTLESYPPGLIVSIGNGQKIFSVSIGGESKLVFGDSQDKSTFVVVIPSSGQPWIGQRYEGTIIPLKENPKGN